jgi:hypothetical protein
LRQGEEHAAAGGWSQRLEGGTRRHERSVGPDRGKADRKITIEQVPELKTRIVTMVVALRKVNDNIHAKHCEPAKCVCLDEKQFRAAILAPYPEPMRGLVEAEIALSD